MNSYVGFLNTTTNRFGTTDSNLRNQARDLMYRMGQITAGLGAGGQGQSKVDFDKANKLALLMKTTGLLGAGAVGSASLAMLRNIINRSGVAGGIGGIVGGVGVGVTAEGAVGTDWSKNTAVSHNAQTAVHDPYDKNWSNILINVGQDTLTAIPVVGIIATIWQGFDAATDENVGLGRSLTRTATGLAVAGLVTAAWAFPPAVIALTAVVAGGNALTRWVTDGERNATDVLGDVIYDTGAKIVQGISDFGKGVSSLLSNVRPKWGRT
jgi:hypothetical protein